MAYKENEKNIEIYYRLTNNFIINTYSIKRAIQYIRDFIKEDIYYKLANFTWEFENKTKLKFKKDIDENGICLYYVINAKNGQKYYFDQKLNILTADKVNKTEKRGII